VEAAFRQRFYNNLKQEQAQATLRKGIKMEGGDINIYINLFEKLVWQAGYCLNEPLTIDIFTSGLPKTHTRRHSKWMGHTPIKNGNKQCCIGSNSTSTSRCAWTPLN